MNYCIKNNYYGVTENYGGICSKTEEKDIGIPTTETILIKELINAYFKIVIQNKEVIKIKDTTEKILFYTLFYNFNLYSQFHRRSTVI